MKIVLGKNVFKFSFFSIFIYLSLLILLIILGFWQLGRADEKRLFLQKQQLSVNKESVKLTSVINNNPDIFRYRKTILTGTYDKKHQYLIDNQMINGQVGYFVMTPFMIEGMDKAVLINRGWIALNKDRGILPKLPIITLNTQLTGRINHFPAVGLVLKGADIPTKSWPSVVQVVNIELLSKKLGYPLLPFQIELDADMNQGFLRNWHEPTVMLPEKHIAYAVQWFGLAITLTLLFFGLSRKK